MGKGKKRKARKKDSVVKYLESSRVVTWGLLAAVMGIFTAIQYPNLFITKHLYSLGDVAEIDIKAPKDFLVEDKQGTQAKREQSAEEVLTVYDLDAQLVSKLNSQIKEAFELARTAIRSEKANLVLNDDSNPQLAEKKAIEEKIWQTKPEFEKIIGISISSGAYKILMKEEFSKDISNLIAKIISEILNNGVVANKDVLLRESKRGIALRTLGTDSERVVINLKQFYGSDQAKTMVRVVAQPLVKDLNYNLINLIVDFCQRIVQPNITLNKSETQQRKQAAVDEVKPVFYKIKTGEMILREGERASELQLLKLRAMQTQKNQEKMYAKSMGALLMVLCLLLTVYFLITHRADRPALRNNKDLLFVCSMLVAFFYLPSICSVLFKSLMHMTTYSVSATSMKFGIPIASGAMTICLFMGLDVAVSFAVVIAACSAVIFDNQFEIFIFFLLNSSMAAYWLQDCRERKVFVRAGIKIGILNILLASAIWVYTGHFSASKLFWDCTFAFLGGIGSGIITAGLVPLLEIAFGYTTDIRLLELANLDRPILRRLMLEAPGTYHHSVIVGSMVEAAASEIGANPLLAKVCGYYHDIGKINKPLYFVENQTDGKNRHDKLAPSMSSLILISHVKHGVEIARENKLGQTIIDTIRQHHGTTLIKYFYEKAKQKKGVDAVKIEDFSYPGPKPQTREAGLVMLADVVEAASRTLENPTPSRIQGNVQKLINMLFTDGQLDNCELTLRDLHNIAKSFNKILNGIHHHRIEYPDSQAVKNGKNGKDKKDKDKDGNPDQQQAKQGKDSTGKNTENGEGNLRRLGIS